LKAAWFADSYLRRVLRVLRVLWHVMVLGGTHAVGVLWHVMVLGGTHAVGVLWHVMVLGGTHADTAEPCTRLRRFM
jgi:hypothetical protein